MNHSYCDSCASCEPSKEQNDVSKFVSVVNLIIMPDNYFG